MVSKTIQTKITEAIIEAMQNQLKNAEKDDKATVKSVLDMPSVNNCNITTGAVYRGLNPLIISAAMISRGWKHAYFLTRKQCEALGGSIKSDAKPLTLYYYIFNSIDDYKTQNDACRSCSVCRYCKLQLKADARADHSLEATCDKFKYTPSHVPFQVYNFEDTEGLTIKGVTNSITNAKTKAKVEAMLGMETDDITSAKVIIDMLRYLESQGVTIDKFASANGYAEEKLSINKDEMRSLVNLIFKTEQKSFIFPTEMVFSFAFAAASKSCLDIRSMQMNKKKEVVVADFNAVNYQTIVALIATMIIAGKLGAKVDITRSSEYIVELCKLLEGDTSLLFLANSSATSISNYLLNGAIQMSKIANSKTA